MGLSISIPIHVGCSHGLPQVRMLASLLNFPMLQRYVPEMLHIFFGVSVLEGEDCTMQHSGSASCSGVTLKAGSVSWLIKSS